MRRLTLAFAAATALLLFLLVRAMRLLKRNDTLGMGDVKFLFVAGIWLANAANFVPFLFFSGVLGVASGIVWKLMGEGERFPFGPALAFALLGCVLFPDMANGFWNLYGFSKE